MSKLIHLHVSDRVYEDALTMAQSHQRSLEEVLANALESVFPPIYQSPDHAELVAQDEAFHQMHSGLVARYHGQYVAVAHGEVIDHDPDEVTLLERVEIEHPNATVLIRQVSQHLPRVLNMPSFRLERDV